MTLKGFRSGVTAVAFSPDGNTLAAGSIDRLVRLWRAKRDLEGFAPADLAQDDEHARLLRTKAEVLAKATAMRNLAEDLEGQGKWAEAETLHREALISWRNYEGSGGWETSY